ncbi:MULTISPECIES: type II secretion system F family protein [Aminobacterium]|uniref:type II secretion system F family protein n=1 Tax=Aminobacterium TaxID=81466 RepID=UPI00257EF420|nr:type II secretion system F family protein [Aminobacterium sp. UBA4834]
MIFRYRARSTSNGERISSGSIKASSKKDAAQKLQAQGLMPVYLRRHVSAELFSFPSRGKRRLSSRFLASFFSQLSSILQAGGTISLALVVIEQECPKASFIPFIKDLRVNLEKGLAFSDSLYESAFLPPGVVPIVKAGEESGKLPKMLSQLSLFFEQKIDFHRKLFTAWLYPAFIGILACFVFGILFNKVLPEIEDFLKRLNIPLPKITRLIIFLSERRKFIGLLTLMFLVFSVVIWHYFRKGFPFDRFNYQRCSISFFRKKFLLVRSLYILAALLEAGMPLLKAIHLTGNATGHEGVQRIWEEVAQKLGQGVPLGRAFREHSFFPSAFAPLVSLGEQTGTLQWVIQKEAEQNKKSLATDFKRVEVLMEPVLTLVIGIFVLFMVVALFMPLMRAVHSLVL